MAAAGSPTCAPHAIAAVAAEVIEVYTTKVPSRRRRSAS